MRMLLSVFVMAGLVGCILLLIFLARKPAVQGVRKIPAPEGRQPVGTTLIFLRDATCDRDLSIQVWYPRSVSANSPPAPYFPFGENPEGPSPGWTTNSCRDAPPASGRWPVIIYSPGWDGGSHQNTGLCEQLASEGFIVFGLNHPGAAPLSVAPDGRRITNSALEKFDLSSASAAAGFERAADRELELRTGDVRFVLASLAELDSGGLANGMFRHTLRPGGAGVLGFSFGGAVAAEVCRLDPLALAGVNLDGRLFGASRRIPSGKPFLMITDNLPPPPESELRSADPAVRRQAEFLYEGYREYELWDSKPGTEIIKIDGISHQDFTDRALDGRPEALAWFHRINRAVTGFFLKNLARDPSAT